MKKLIFILLFSIVALLCNAQYFDWDWAKQQTTGTGSGRSVAVDGDGNSIICGHFNDSISFFNSSVITGSNFCSGYIAKFDSTGNLMWLNALTGTASIYQSSVTTDTNNHIYVTGTFSGTITVNGVSYTSPFGDEIFIVKLDEDGNYIWTKRLSCDYYDPQCNSIVCDGLNNVYVTGGFGDTLTFGNIQLSSGPNKDIFIAKFNSDGDILFAFQEEGIHLDVGKSIKVDNSGNMYVTGFFGDTLSIGDTMLIAHGNLDVFVAKYNSNTDLEWAASIGSDNQDNECKGISLEVDKEYNVIVIGIIAGEINFGDTIVSTPYFAFVNDTVYLTNYFLAKYGSNGDPLWIITEANTGEGDYSVSTDQDNNIYAVGAFLDTAYFGGNQVISNGYGDIFIVKYDGNGVILGLEGIGGVSSDDVSSIISDIHENIYITGGFHGSVSFGNTTISSQSSWASYIAKIRGNPIGIEDFVNTPSINIYPNPGNNKVNVQIKSNTTTDLLLQIIDLKGNTIINKKLVSESFNGTDEIDVSNYTKGIYLFRLISDKNSITKKIVVL